MKKNKSIKKSPEYDNLYISMVDVNNKRKSLLSTIKDSLIMQEEYEKVKSLRKSKFDILNDIKKNMKNINLGYQKLKKVLPNVKNVLAYTENELSHLEDQVSMLKSNISSENNEILKNESLITSLNSGNVLSKISPNKKKPIVKKVVKKVHKDVSKELSKLDRIKNNLKVIEAKLGDI